MSQRARARRTVPLSAVVGIVIAIEALTPAAVAAAPTTPSLTVHLRAAAPVNALGVPAEVRWTGVAPSGPASYRLQRRVDRGPWTTISLAEPTSQRASVTLEAWRVHEFRVAAVDASGAPGPWTASSPIRARMALETASAAAYVGSWVRRVSPPLLEGATREALSAGSSVRFKVRARGIAWVATRGSGRGAATVTIDGAPAATVDLNADSTAHRRIVWATTWPTTDTHAVEISAIRTPIDLDGLIVLEAPSRDPVLAGAGDIARCSWDGDEATARLLDDIPGTVFAAGDNAYWDGTIKEFDQCYGPSWGRHRDRTRPVPGNHEYQTAGAAGYKAYFGSLAMPSGTTWYAYDLGAWRIYALDSECLAVGGCGAASAQGRWLTDDLARHPRRCVAAIWHVPLFSSGEHGSNRRMAWAWRTLDAAGAELVISGHDHDYERFARQHADGSRSENGLREFIVGTGGAKLRPFRWALRNSVVRWSGSNGILVLTLHPSGYSWRFAAVPGSSFRDAGTTPCS
jgi:Calcineurin-like phosphoesterase